MKIAAAKIDNFIKSPDANVKSALLYGPDAGLVSQRKQLLSKVIIDDLNDPFCLSDLDLDKIKEDPALLSDELNSISLTGGRRLIRVSCDSSSAPNDIGEILENSKSDSFSIFTAGNLATSSSLRKLFEKGKTLAALPCYTDDDRSIGQLVAGKLKENGISYNYDVIQYLSGSFSGDRLVILNEVKKLITYLGDEKTLTLEQTQECIVDSGQMSYDDLCNAVASRDITTIDKSLNKAFSEGVNPIPLIRTVSSYFIKIQYVKSQIENGTPEQSAISSLRPPMFFKQVPVFKKHLNSWNSKSISKMIQALTDLEIQCKQTGSPAELLCARAFTILPIAI